MIFLLCCLTSLSMTLSRPIHGATDGSMWGFSGFIEQGPLFVVMFGLLIAVASLVEHGFWVRGFL